MTLYAIHAMIHTHDGEWNGSRAVPTFYLDGRVQGIVDRHGAESIAADVINPLGTIDPADLLVSAYPVNPARESAELDRCEADRIAQDGEWVEFLNSSDYPCSVGRHAKPE
jgi:hypothetical protein